MVDLAPLRDRLRADQVVTKRAVLIEHSRGESFAEAVLPEVVVYAESREDVQAVVAIACEQRIAVTPVGANSSLEGQTVPVQGGISLDVTRMDRIVEVCPEDLLAVVQPGVPYPSLNDRVRHSGLFFPVDPGAHATLGGMVATNASGTTAVRYGVTADHVLALEFVTPEGDVVRTGSRARKSSSGYNLTRLLAGSEGTLGVITEITLRLTGLPEAVMAARVPFGSALAATGYVTSVMQAGLPVARCELVDAGTIAAVNRHLDTGYPEEMTVFMEFHGNEEGIRVDAELSRELADAAGALAFESSGDPPERERLWQARHQAFYAYLALNPGRRSVVTDVAVPISWLAANVTGALADCEREGLQAYLVGHVGDGNFHLAIFFDGADRRSQEQVEEVSGRVIARALGSGGTITGEHGVGLRKLKHMAQEHGAALEVMRRIKQCLDPLGIMNPGKKIP